MNPGSFIDLLDLESVVNKSNANNEVILITNYLAWLFLLTQFVDVIWDQFYMWEQF